MLSLQPKTAAEMKCQYNVDMKVDPLVVKWMDARFRKERGIYRLQESRWYTLVSMALCQSARAERVSLPPEKYSGFVPVKIGITEYDFYHYGWEVNMTQEIRMSRLLRDIICDEILRNAAIIRARYEISLSRAVNNIIVFYNLTEDDVRFETLRKRYRREYLVLEEEYRALDRAALTDFTGDESEMPPRRKLNVKARNPQGQLDIFDTEPKKPTIWKT